MICASCGGEGGTASTNNAVADTGGHGDPDTGCQPTAEVCDGQDNDCDGEIDEDDADDARVFYPDNDQDGFGVESGGVTTCSQPAGYVATAGDCDDGDAALHPDAAEMCDGVDTNCDGQLDEGDIVPRDCANQEGVCAGSTVTTCDMGAYAECGAEEFGPFYRASNGEGWRCDGLDNNCDGGADEACCGDASGIPIPTPALIGETDEDQSLVTMTRAASDAPDRAAFLVGWRTDRRITLQHVDKAGEAVGAAVSFVVEGLGYGLDVTSTDSGYEVVWTGGRILRQESGGGLLETETWLKVRGYTAELAEDGAIHTFHEHHFDYPDVRDEPHRLHEPQVAAIGDTRLLVYVSDRYSLDFKVFATRYNALDRANPQATLELSGSGAESADALPHPVVDAYGSTFVTAWTNSRGGQVRGRSFAIDGTPGPSFDVPLTNGAGDVSLDIAQTGDDQLMLIYPKPDAANPPLVGLPVTISTGEIGSEVQLADAATPNSWPQAVATDTDGDSVPDRLVIAWRRGADADPAIVVGATSVVTPGLITDQRPLRAAGQESMTPKLVAGDEALGAAWLATAQQDRVEFVPVSIDGVAICRPAL